MKFLHTADWHVGKTLQGRNRAEEHTEVLAEITAVAQREKVDAILIAGDVFDSASPSPESERIVYRALLDLRAVAPVVVIPGNHDNARRLAAAAPVFAHASVNVRSFIERDPLLIETSSGPLRIAAIPWLSQRYIVKAHDLMYKDAAEMTQRFGARMRSIVTSLTSSFTSDAVNVVIGHVTIAGGETGGGERTAQTIEDYWVDGTAFPASAHYVALGHLHKSQKMPGPCPIWYPGSPMHLDFSDKTDSKSVLLVEAAPGVPATTEAIALSAGRRLRTVEGTLEQLRTLGDQGADYLRVIVNEPARTGLGNEIRELFPNAVKVIINSEDDGRSPGKRHDRVHASPRDLFSEYLGHKNIVDERLVKLFDELYEEAHASHEA